MYEHYRNTTLTVAVLCLLTSAGLGAQTLADNTKVNTRDRAKGAVTADQQKDNATDHDLTQKIRQALMQDKSLSTYAHNVKVVAQGGTVTLKGSPTRPLARKSGVYDGYAL